MRLYRGIKKRYDPTKVGGDRLSGTDFTDCPAMALRYAQGRGGVVLVLDVPEGGVPGVTEELWLGSTVKRYMVWGKFDSCLVATLPAKGLRTYLREMGLRNADDEHRGIVLERFIAAEIKSSASAESGPARIARG